MILWHKLNPNLIYSVSESRPIPTKKIHLFHVVLLYTRLRAYERTRKEKKKANCIWYVNKWMMRGERPIRMPWRMNCTFQWNTFKALVSVQMCQTDMKRRRKMNRINKSCSSIKIDLICQKHLFISFITWAYLDRIGMYWNGESKTILMDNNNKHLMFVSLSLKWTVHVITFSFFYQF